MRATGLALTLTLALLLAAVARAAPSQLYFSDSFAGLGERAFYEGELDGRQFRYTGGEYEIDTTRGAAYGQSVLLEALSTYRVEVAARMVSTQDEQRGGCGISFNYRARENGQGGDFLLFMVYNRGAFTVLRYFDGRTSVLYSPTRTQLVKPGVAAVLAVDAVNGQITCYINGVELASVKEDQLSSGGFGVFCTAQSVARFDDFKVYADKPRPATAADDFSARKQLYEGDWDGAKYSYTGGRYVVDTSGTQYIGLSPFPAPAQDFELAVDAELLAGTPTTGYGVYIRDYKPSEKRYNQFRFLLSEDWYAVEQSVDDRPLALAEWAQHSAVHASGVNRLKVTARGGELHYFVNSVEVWRGTDEHPHAGAYGFYVSGGLEVAFDNFSFTPLD
jgi:hypothetical protein